MRSRLTLGFVAILVGCAQLAGLDDFHPRADGGGASTGGDDSGGGAGATGGQGGGGGEPSVGGQPEGGSGGQGCAEHLLLTEARTVGSNGGSDDFVEIYNPTAAAVPLLDVSLTARSPTGPLGERWRGGADDVLEPHGFILIAGMNFDDGTGVDVSLPSNKSFGDDFIILLEDPSGGVIDIVCLCTSGCSGDSWNGCQGVVLDNPGYVGGQQVDTDVSVQRVPECVDTDAKSDWVQAPATPGADNAT